MQDPDTSHQRGTKQTAEEKKLKAVYREQVAMTMKKLDEVWQMTGDLSPAANVLLGLAFIKVLELTLPDYIKQKHAAETCLATIKLTPITTQKEEEGGVDKQ